MSTTQKAVLNVGGNSKSIPIPEYYDGWRHDLLDIDPKGNPEVCMDARNLINYKANEYDAVYCSHNLEHYHRHDGKKVLQGFVKVLKADGFAEIRVPDLGAIIKHVAANNLDVDDVLYHTKTKAPILVRDTFFGYHVQIEKSGEDFYAHKTGFTAKSLANFVGSAGFVAVGVAQLQGFELRAYAFKQSPTPELIKMLGIKVSGI